MEALEARRDEKQGPKIPGLPEESLEGPGLRVHPGCLHGLVGWEGRQTEKECSEGAGEMGLLGSKVEAEPSNLETHFGTPEKV